MHELRRYAGIGRIAMESFFFWTFMQPYCVEVVIIGKLQLLYSNAEFHFLYKCTRNMTEFRKVTSHLYFKMIHVFHFPLYFVVKLILVL